MHKETLFSRELRFLTERICRKRGFYNSDLVLVWKDLVGEVYAPFTRPHKVIHIPKRERKGPEKKTFDEERLSSTQTAILVVQVDSTISVLFRYAQVSVVERINMFLGWHAIEKLKIIPGTFSGGTRQKPEHCLPTERPSRTPADCRHLDKYLVEITDPSLREACRELMYRLPDTEPVEVPGA